MYNLRYHIATLVSVFLALSIGLLLGTVVVERGVIDAQRTTLVQSIQKDVLRARSENATVRASNDRLTAFASQAVPQLVAHSLAGRTIVVLADRDSAEAVSRVQEAVRQAGGKTAVATLAGARLALDDEKVHAAAMSALGSPEESQLETRVIDVLAKEWTTPGDSRMLTRALVAAGGLKLDGLAGTDAVAGTAVSVAFDGKPDASAIALARSLSTQGRFAAGVETTKRHSGQAAAAIRGGLSAVDDVDEPLGELSLVWILTGRTAGSYGTSASADSAFPDPLFPQQ